MSRTFEQVKNDPLYRQWCEADTIHRAVVKRFCFDFKTKLDDAKLQIESELRERYRDEISLSSSSVNQVRLHDIPKSMIGNRMPDMVIYDSPRQELADLN